MEWAYGITTVPSRRHELFPRTLASLRKAGFDKPRIFVDGDKDGASWVREFGLETVCRYPIIRPFGNWLLSLQELCIRQPKADRYALFQDDFLTYKNLRGYLEECNYKGKEYWNLYTFPDNFQRVPTEQHKPKICWFPSNQLGLGAVALVFDRTTALALLSNRMFLQRPEDAERGHKNIDGGIVHCLKRLGWREYVHYPSLVYHTGDKSSRGGGKQPQTPCFFGEDFDAMELVKHLKR